MLSAEIATGLHPLQTIEAVNGAALYAENEYLSYTQTSILEEAFSKKDESIALAAIYT
jgi:pyruvate kinase